MEKMPLPPLRVDPHRGRGLCPLRAERIRSHVVVCGKEERPELYRRLDEVAQKVNGVHCETVGRPYSAHPVEEGVEVLRPELTGVPVDFYVNCHGGLEMGMRLRICRDIAEATAALHEAGVWLEAKDLGCILIVNNRGMVVDVGSLRGMETSEFEAMDILVKGPDGVREGGGVTKKTDIWFLGVVFYLICTGRLPWNETNVLRMMRVVMEKEVVFPEDMDRDMEFIIRSMMSKDGRDRPTGEMVCMMLGTIIESVAPEKGSEMQHTPILRIPTLTELIGNSPQLRRSLPARTRSHSINQIARQPLSFIEDEDI